MTPGLTTTWVFSLIYCRYKQHILYMWLLYTTWYSGHVFNLRPGWIFNWCQGRSVDFCLFCHWTSLAFHYSKTSIFRMCRQELKTLLLRYRQNTDIVSTLGFALCQTGCVKPSGAGHIRSDISYNLDVPLSDVCNISLWDTNLSQKHFKRIIYFCTKCNFFSLRHYFVCSILYTLLV